MIKNILGGIIFMYCEIDSAIFSEIKVGITVYMLNKIKKRI
jgi:hypothetical protein